MKIWAYGDSFTAGDQDVPQSHSNYLEISKKEKYEISYVAQLAKLFASELENKAKPGSGNFPQLDLLIQDLSNIEDEDLVIFGITTSTRDRGNIITRGDNPLLSPSWGHSTIHPDIELNRIWENDQLITISVLDKIAEMGKFKLIYFYVFHKTIEDYDYCSNNLLFKETLVDVLTDFKFVGYGNPGHKYDMIPEEYKKYFTEKYHPSPEGHIKFAKWAHEKIS